MSTPDYKSSIRLPQTDFPMKGNLAQKEPEVLAQWKANGIYAAMTEGKKIDGKLKPRFVLPDGPPYANGAIHMGHALNKCLKDFIIKYKNMSGFQASFIPGWDCHGLPIEHTVMKSLAEKKLVKTDEEILQMCREEAQKWVNFQRESFIRLGVLADWENPYLTMNKKYEAEEVREFARAFDRGNIYRGAKPVYWNWTLKTALADAEVEYHNHKSPSIYVKFTVSDSTSLKRLGNPSGKTSFVIWTTTPWTLPANLGICLHPDFEYGVFSCQQLAGENLIIAKSLKEFFEKETGLLLNLISSHKGQDLELTKARHPWIDRDSKIVLGLHVTQDAGTGCVHTAPGHGADDFKVGQKYQLGVLCPVDDAGKFTDEVPEFAGQNIFKANPLIIQKLKDSGHLLFTKEIEHSYPHCWRSKTPLIFRTTPQWFLGIDLENSQVRKNILEALSKIHFVPAWGEARFRAMMETRPDWCLSRQRIWGVPIPILYCKKTGEPFAHTKLMMKIADLIESKGLEGYWLTAPEILAEGVPYPKNAPKDFGQEGFRHGKDILDVWFDSGISYAALEKIYPSMSFPADIYLEGSDQHRGWFNTSMLSAMATREKAPFKTLLTHGFVTDSQGRKMSKSLGNYVDPLELTKTSGAEIIRLWVAYSDYGQDMGCGKDELSRVTETYRRMRNTMRYLLGSLNDFDFAKDAVKYADLGKLDQWALHELKSLNDKIQQAYEAYEFHKVYHGLNNFFTVQLSATYLDILKDRLYTWKADGRPRRGAQTVIYHITDSLIKMMAPILSFLAEESWSYFKGKNTESIFLTEFPKAPEIWKNEKVAQDYESLLRVRSDAQKQLENLRNQKIIGASLEAKLAIHANGELLKSLQQAEDLREFFIVSEFELKDGEYQVQAFKAEGEKCIRCWVYSKQIKQAPAHLPGICPKCVEALS